MCPRCEGLVLFMLSAPWDLRYVIKVTFYCICFSICPYLYFILPIRPQGSLESFPWTCWLSRCIDHILFEKNEGLPWNLLPSLDFFMCNQYLTGHGEADFSGSDGEEGSRKPNAKELLINRDHVPLGLCSGAGFEVGHRKATWHHEQINQSVIWMEIKSKSNFSFQGSCYFAFCFSIAVYAVALNNRVDWEGARTVL